MNNAQIPIQRYDSKRQESIYATARTNIDWLLQLLDQHMEQTDHHVKSTKVLANPEKS